MNTLPRTAAQEPVAVIEGLRVETGGRVVLDGVDLSLRPGRITALTGGSGSGKTTMGLALLGEYPAGARVTGSVRVRQGSIGYVPQHPAAVLNPARRIGALLMDIARDRVRDLPRSRRRAAARERVLDALARVRLPAGCCAASRTSSPGVNSSASSSPRCCCSARASSSRTSRPPGRTR